MELLLRILTAIAVVSIMRELSVLGELTILRGPSKNTNNKPKDRWIECTSGDDGGALVWNDDLQRRNTTFPPNNIFEDKPNPEHSTIDCLSVHPDDCYEQWEKNGWTVTESIEKPMGPVMDRRWEDFEEINLGKGRGYGNGTAIPETGAIVFSIRGTKGVYLFLGRPPNFFYRILIGPQDGGMPEILKRKLRITTKIENCTWQAKGKYEDSTLSPIEWRTFILKWSAVKGTVAVYNEKGEIASYQPQNWNKITRLYMKSECKTLYRFHFYKYLHATKEKEKLQSPEFKVTNSILCYDMLIGLCAGCTMNISIVEGNLSTYMSETVLPKKSLGADDLPQWQHFRINKTISDSIEAVRLQMITVLQHDDSSPLWAIANVQKCKKQDTVREYRSKVVQFWEVNKYIWPDNWCQKLSYTGGSLVSATSNITKNPKHDMSLCEATKVGPHCMIYCSDIPRVSSYCQNLEICNDKGCTCAQGLQGRYCNESCDHTYGYNCEKPCGNCNTGHCESLKGHCESGCKGNFLLPNCHKDASKLSPPVLLVNETSARVSLDVKQFAQLGFLYQLIIQVRDKSENVIDEDDILKNATTLEYVFNNLKHGTSYAVRVLQKVDGPSYPIPAFARIFTTHCKPSENISWTPGERNITLKIINAPRENYSCPASWYRVTSETVQRTDQRNHSLESFTHSFTGFTPYTNYTMKITGKSNYNRSKDVQTSIAAPSEILNLNISNITDRGFVLEWQQPKYLNGPYISYNISIKGIQLLGCSEEQVAPNASYYTEQNTRSSFNDLRPYTRYNVIVWAFTNKPGPIISHFFNTSAREMPTSVVSNLWSKGNTIRWEKPQDCTTITGPVDKVKLVFEGISSWVQNFTDEQETSKECFEFGTDGKKPPIIYGATTYRVRVYVMREDGRKFNSTAFRELNFTTKPQAPPKVRNLTIYETNTYFVRLRWSPPQLPHYGELENYHLQLCEMNLCHSLRAISINKPCELWPGYICYRVRVTKHITKIEMWAQNKYVTEGWNKLSVKTIKKEEVAVSEEPKILTVEVLANGVATLKWLHPWKTNSKLEGFAIKTEVIKSDLRGFSSRNEYNTRKEHSVAFYQDKYEESIYLLPSTQYNFSVAAKTSKGLGQWSNKVSWTPSALAFTSNITTNGRSTTSTFQINIPEISNDTVDSLKYIIVKKKEPCGKCNPALMPPINLDHSECAWITAILSTEEITRRSFTVGDNKMYRNARNCPLKPRENYTAMVVIHVGNEHTQIENIPSYPISFQTSATPPENLPEEAEQNGLLWLLIIPIIAIVALVTYHSHRKRTITSEQLRLRKTISLPQNTMTPEYLEILPTELSKIPPPNSEPITSFANDNELEVFRAMNWDSTEYEYVYLIQVQQFEEYVKNAFETGILVKQFSMFPKGQTKLWEYGKLPQNRRKNQYGHLIAYDETRVILKKLPSQPYSDYINANYIGGYDKEKAYIATQGTNPHTVIDFWRMVWQEGVHVICLLCNVFEEGKKKFEQYWPEVGFKIRYGDVVVFNAEHKVFADYTFRTFHVTHNQLTREIKHLHYTAWQNHESLMYSHSLVPYLRKLVDLPPGNDPVVIQSTAGIGRAGVIILCDICLRRAAVEGVVDVVAEMKKIRRNRANMVDNNQQYLLAHLAIAESLHALQTTIPCDEDLPTKIHHMKQQSASQLERLQAIAWYDKALNPEDFHRPLTMKERDKNRYPDLAPDCNKKVTLKRYEFSMGGSDYITAVYVDGVRSRDQNVATQVPLPSTRNDFWRMILEQEVELIVILQSNDPEDDTCCEIVEGEEFNPLPFLKITAMSQSNFKHFTTQILQLSDTSENTREIQPVTILRCKGWKPGRGGDPPSTSTLVALWQAAEKISRKGPMVAVCHDGVTGCGLYFAMAFLLERMSLEQECDVFLAIRAVRRSRPQFVQSLEQIEILYDVAANYSHYFAAYADCY